MKKHYTSLLLTLTATVLLFGACDKDSMAPFASSFPPVDERFELSQVYNSEHGFATLQAKSKDYNIYVCTDTHLSVKYSDIIDAQSRGEDPLALLSNLSTFIRLYHEDKQCPAAICLGDLVEANNSYEVFRYAIENTPVSPSKKDTMFCTIGNHDIFYNQYYAYQHHISPTATYYFEVKIPGGKKDLFICLDTATGTLGRKQIQWLKDLLEQVDKKQTYRHIIVYSHVNMFRRDNTSADISTTSLEETYELMSLFRKYHVEQFWAGHDHSREEFLHGGVKYIIVDSMEEQSKDAAFMILHVGDELNNTFHLIAPYKADYGL